MSIVAKRSPISATAGLLFIIPPYGSMVGILSLLLFVSLYGYGFLSGGKDSGVKLRVLVRLLSRMSFFHFGQLSPRARRLFTGYTNRTWEKFAFSPRGRHMVGFVSC